MSFKSFNEPRINVELRGGPLGGHIIGPLLAGTTSYCRFVFGHGFAIYSFKGEENEFGLPIFDYAVEDYVAEDYDQSEVTIIADNVERDEDGVPIEHEVECRYAPTPPPERSSTPVRLRPAFLWVCPNCQITTCIDPPLGEPVECVEVYCDQCHTIFPVEGESSG